MPIALTTVKPPEGGDFAVDHMLGYGIIFLLDFTGSYVAGGEVVSAPRDLKTVFKRLGAGTLIFVSIPNRLGYSFDYDYAVDKILVRQGDNTNAASAPGIELPAAAYPVGITGLTGVNRVRGFALGR